MCQISHEKKSGSKVCQEDVNTNSRKPKARRFSEEEEEEVEVHF